MDTSTYKERILALLTKEDKPLKAKEICLLLQENNGYCWPPTLRVVLSLLVTQKILGTAKYKFTPSVYGKPEWFKNGKVKEELNFNPHWKKTKHELTN